MIYRIYLFSFLLIGLCPFLSLAQKPSSQLSAFPDLLLTSDRRLYHPGQELKIRVLAFRQGERRPLAKEQISIQIHGGGYVLMRQDLQTDSFGVVSLSFPISEEATEGIWQISAQARGQSVRRKIELKSYRKPRFRMKLKLPKEISTKEPFQVSFEAHYLQGSPVAGGALILTATSIQGREAQEFLELQQILDGNGQAQLSIPLKGARYHESLKLSLKLADPSGHIEQQSFQIPFEGASLLLNIAWLHPPLRGVENRLMLSAQRRDGAPIDLPLTLLGPEGRSWLLHTGADGVALLDLPLNGAGRVRLEATEQSKELKIELSRTPKPERLEELQKLKKSPVLFLRTQGVVLISKRAALRAGEALPLELRSPDWEGRRVALALSLGGVILEQRWLELTGRVSSLSLPIPADLKGLASVALLAEGEVQELPFLILDKQEDLQVKLSLKAKGLSRPGGEAEVLLSLRDARGQPVQAALELGILDEGIYALGGEGLSGREPLFSLLPSAALSATALPKHFEGAWSVLLKEQSFQESLLPWLMAQPPRKGWIQKLPEQKPAIKPPTPDWLLKLAEFLKPLPSLMGPRLPFRLLSWSLAILMMLSLLIYRRRLQGRTQRISISVSLLLLLLLPLLSWGPGPSEKQQALTEQLENGKAVPFSILGGEVRSPVLPEVRGFPKLPEHRHFRGFNFNPHQRFAPDTGTLLHVFRDRVEVNGTQVLSLDNFRVSQADLQGDQDSFQIQPLFKHLNQQARQLKEHAQLLSERFRGVLSLIAAPETPYLLITKLLYTAGQAEFQTFQVVQPSDLKVISPDWPFSWPLFILLMLALLPMLLLERLGWPSYLLWLLLCAYAGFQALAHRSPALDLEGLSFPLEESSLKLCTGLLFLLIAALLWELLYKRRPPSVSYGGLSLSLLLLSLPQSRDLQDYLLTPERGISTPRFGSGSIEARAASTAVQKPQSYIRRSFPDTLLYEPQLITDAQGEARIPLTLGDQLTTWQGTALAHSMGGTMALGRASLKVSQALQLELSLPPQMLVGDELELPISLYNHGEEALKLQVALEPAPWFEATQLSQAIEVPAKSSAGLLFPIKLLKVGQHSLSARAWGPGVFDAVEAPLRVSSLSAWPADWSWTFFLKPDQQGSFEIPATPVPGSLKLELRTYEGLNSLSFQSAMRLLKIPAGCAEQTISSTLPNLTVLKMSAESAQREEARRNLLEGYQRLLRFRHPKGGFSLFPGAEPSPWLSAYALELLIPLKEQLSIGEELIFEAKRALSQGLFKIPAHQRGMALRSTARALKQQPEFSLRAALFTALSLEISKVQDRKEPYETALLLGTLQDLEIDTELQSQLLERLKAQAQRDSRGCHWASSWTTAGSLGRGAQIETTALVAIALRRAGAHQLADEASLWLINQRGWDGLWISSQDSLRALEALRQDPRLQREVPPLKLALNGQALPRGEALLSGGSHLKGLAAQLRVEGSQKLQALKGEGVCSLHMRFQSLERPLSQLLTPLRLSASYHPQRLRQGEQTLLRLRLEGQTQNGMLLLHIPLPPGFGLDREAVEALVNTKKIQRFELSRGQLQLYLMKLPPQGLELEIPLWAQTQLKIRTQPPQLSYYYQPQQLSVAQPSTLEVLPPLPKSVKAPKFKTLDRLFRLSSLLPTAPWPQAQREHLSPAQRSPQPWYLKPTHSRYAAKLKFIGDGLWDKSSALREILGAYEPQAKRPKKHPRLTIPRPVVRGSLSTAKARASLLKALPELSACTGEIFSEMDLALAQAGAYEPLLVQLTIDEPGAVTEVQIQGKEPACLEQIFRKIRFPAHQGPLSIELLLLYQW